MAAVATRPPPRPSYTRLDRVAQSIVVLACAVILAVAGHGIFTWSVLPDFPPPAANESLLLLRRAITAVLAVCGAVLIPFAAGARALRILGAGACLVATIGLVFAGQAYRDQAWATALDLAAVVAIFAALMLIAAALAPRRQS